MRPIIINTPEQKTAPAPEPKQVKIEKRKREEKEEVFTEGPPPSGA